MVIVHSKLLVYQRVTHHSSPFIDDLPFPKIPAWELLGKKGPDILMDILISHHLNFLQLSLYKKHHPQSTSCRQESNHDTPNYSIYMHIYNYAYIYLLWSASPGFSISWFKAFLLGESMRIRLFTNVHNILPFTNNLFLNNYKSTGWWFQPLWKILVNGKDYPIYYGKQKMFETTNQSI